jgi:hypothetical protein
MSSGLTAPIVKRGCSAHSFLLINSGESSKSSLTPINNHRKARQHRASPSYIDWAGRGLRIDSTRWSCLSMRTNDNNYYTKPKCILMAFVLSSAHLGAVATRSVRGCSETAAGSALATPAADVASWTAATRHRSLRAAGRASVAAAGTSLTNFAGAMGERGNSEGGRERGRFLRS